MIIPDPVPWEKVYEDSFDPEWWLRFLRKVNPEAPSVFFPRQEKTGWSFIPWNLERIPQKELLEGFPVSARPADKQPEDGRPPFYSGFVCLVPFLGVGECEKIIAYRCHGSVAYDHREECLYVPTPLLEAMKGEGAVWSRPDSGHVSRGIALSPDMTETLYREQFARVLDGIDRGAFYQVNLAMTFSGPDPGMDPLVLFRHLSRSNPSPASAYYDDGQRWIVSNSPERLFSLSGGTLTTSPIAGTLSLPASPGKEDRGRTGPGERSLLDDPKEHAEHVMTVDLLRNDLGKICRPGSVHVSRFLGVERYSHLWHLVSDIRGDLVDATTLGDILAAMMPGGSVTGAPKKASTEAIMMLELSSREYYCGSLGFWDPVTGFGDFNLLIRTVFQEKGRLRVPVGSGLVADSIAQNEVREIRSKYQAIADALGGG